MKKNIFSISAIILALGSIGSAYLKVYYAVKYPPTEELVMHFFGGGFYTKLSVVLALLSIVVVIIGLKRKETNSKKLLFINIPLTITGLIITITLLYLSMLFYDSAIEFLKQFMVI